MYSYVFRSWWGKAVPAFELCLCCKDKLFGDKCMFAKTGSFCRAVLATAISPASGSTRARVRHTVLDVFASGDSGPRNSAGGPASTGSGPAALIKRKQLYVRSLF